MDPSLQFDLGYLAFLGAFVLIGLALATVMDALSAWRARRKRQGR